MLTRTINLHSALEDICQEFAAASFASSFDHYKKRNQSNAFKIIEDIKVGKMGEIGAYMLLKETFPLISEPDYEIYPPGSKTFEADLSAENLNFHCKTQHILSANRYGISWVFQFNGNGTGHRDPLFEVVGDNDYFVPMLLDGDKVIIYGVIPVNILVQKELFKHPKLDYLKDIKRCIYLEDLETLSFTERWGVVYG